MRVLNGKSQQPMNCTLVVVQTVGLDPLRFLVSVLEALANEGMCDVAGKLGVIRGAGWGCESFRSC